MDNFKSANRPFIKKPRVGKTVYSYYCLDFLHPGHLLFMKNAWNLAGPGGKSIVGILSDKAIEEKKPKPIMPLHDRIAIAQSLRFVDLVIPQETYLPIENIERLKPDILVESASHSRQDIENARDAMRKWGGRVVVLPYFSEYSSSAVKEKIISTIETISTNEAN